MTLEKRREIASKGGQSVKPENRAFAQDRELAAEAGRKGGAQSTGKRRRRVAVRRSRKPPDSASAASETAVTEIAAQ